MALHRDIYWVGRQWAVTGLGLQAVDQKRWAAFDIEASRLWTGDSLVRLRREPWVNSDDLEKALAAARRYFPEPAGMDISSLLEDDRSLEAAAPAPTQAWLPARARFIRPWRIRFRRKNVS